MQFNPGENKIRRGRTTYIRDAVQTQIDPVQKEIKPKKDESVQQQQVVQKSVSTGSKPKRKQSGPRSKSNG